MRPHTLLPLLVLASAAPVAKPQGGLPDLSGYLSSLTGGSSLPDLSGVLASLGLPDITSLFGSLGSVLGFGRTTTMAGNA